MLLVPGPEGEIGREPWGCVTSQQGLLWGPQGPHWGSGWPVPAKLLKCGRGPRHPVPPLLSWWLGLSSVAVPTLSTPLQEHLEASHTTYVRQHPELLALLADFLQALLLQQPPDPISFAAQFFAPFACQFPAGTPFASARAASPQLRHPPANGE